MKNNFYLIIRCETYNHSHYIKDALNGFCIQKTNFPFLIALIDDFSSDGEQVVVADYIKDNFDTTEDLNLVNEETEDASIIYARHKYNINCFIMVCNLKYNHYQINKDKWSYINKYEEASKYIAICEGDDYWVDPDKLQRQVDFLNQNNDYSACFHNAFIYETAHNISSSRLMNNKTSDTDLLLEEAVNRWIVPSASLIYRSPFRILPEWMAKIYSDDYSMILYLFYKGKIRYINSVSSVYRVIVGGNSVSQRVKSEFVRSEYIKLLESYNKGTNFIYNDVVGERLRLLYNQTKLFRSISSHRYYNLIFCYPAISYYIRKYIKK